MEGEISKLTNAVYRDLAGIAKWQGILDTAVRAKTKWQMHVEVVTNVVPTVK
jgi:pyruvate formate lyase activating enzyme